MKTEEEVRDEFVKGLELPARSLWPAKQMILAPVGLPGTGKTTVVKPLARELGLVRVSSDELRKMLKEHGHGWDTIKELLFPVDEQLASKGYSIAFDADTGNRETVAFIEKLSRQYNLKVFWIGFDTPKEFVFEKFRKHSPSWLADSPEKRIKNYKAQEMRHKEHQYEYDFIYTFDISRDTVDAQIQECLTLIKAAL